MAETDTRDLVEDLRGEADHLEAHGMLQGVAIIREAADEIERLRAPKTEGADDGE